MRQKGFLINSNFQIQFEMWLCGPTRFSILKERNLSGLKIELFLTDHTRENDMGKRTFKPFTLAKINTIPVKPRKWLILGPVICQNRHFQVAIKIVICEVLNGHLQGMRTLNSNCHLARFITFEAVICEVLLYSVNKHTHLLGSV